MSVNRHASGIAQVWRAAFDKRIQTLLVRPASNIRPTSPRRATACSPTRAGGRGPRRRRGRADRKGHRRGRRGILLRSRRPRPAPADRGRAPLLSRPRADDYRIKCHKAQRDNGMFRVENLPFTNRERSKMCNAALFSTALFLALVPRLGAEPSSAIQEATKLHSCSMTSGNGRCGSTRSSPPASATIGITTS